jgi:hypothetical protein
MSMNEGFISAVGSKTHKKRVYRRRTKTSSCRGKSFTKCRLRDGCKRTMAGKRKSYCRSRKNTAVYKSRKINNIVLKKSSSDSRSSAYATANSMISSDDRSRDHIRTR